MYDRGTFIVLSISSQSTITPRTPYNAGMESNGVLLTRQTSGSPSAKLSEVFGGPRVGRAPFYSELLVRRFSAHCVHLLAY